MPTKLLAIAFNTFLESVRQPIYFVLLLSGLLLQMFNILLSAYSMGYSDSSEVSSDDKLLLDMGLATVFTIATLLAALISTSIMSREIENKTALTVISKPVSRPVFVIGKYLGSTAALVLATVIQLIFLQLAIRHTVLSTASDHVDPVVVTFLGLSLMLGIGVGAWGNYFYGWVFSSTAVYVLTPALMIALPLTLMIDKNWIIQPISTDFKPQIALASVTLLMAIPVLSAIALAASTRLTQVMTISVCVGMFLLGLLSNYLFGRHVYINSPIASIGQVEVIQDRDGDFRDGGDILRLKLDGPPSVDLQPGQVIYYGASPDGLALDVPNQRPFVGDPLDPNDYNRPGTPPNVVVREVEPPVEDVYHIKILNAGNMQTVRPPLEGEFLFTTPTTIYWPARVAWSIVPNLQFFWLVDAITQTHAIPPRYVLLTAAYSGVQVIGFVSLAVILFQRREVG
jgi:ABC-type transport system involved in multi-copper enzyme maturation permease subunit